MTELKIRGGVVDRGQVVDHARRYSLYAQAVQQDPRREVEAWEDINALAPRPPITPLRALDIVAWWVDHPGRAHPAST